MKKTDVVSVEVNASQVPGIIQEQFKGLKELKQNVNEAIKKADKANDAAQVAKGKSAGLFQKKEAIESLQEATVNLADAQITATKAQKVSFEYQQKLAEMTKYLFALGVSNIAMNRSVVRELELKLKGASKEELDEFARQEIISVVKQLKAQEDIMKKQSDLTEKVKVHETTLRTHAQKDFEYDKKLREHEEHEKKQDGILRKHSEKDEEHDRLIAGNKQKTLEHDKMLAENKQKTLEHDKMLAENKQKTLEHDKMLAEKTKKDRNQDEEIARQAVMDVELGKRIDAGEEKDKSQDEEMARQAAKDEELAKMIEGLMESNLEKESQIRELKTICENLSKRISNHASMVEEKEMGILDRLNEKASKKMVLISYIIGLVGFLVAIIQFFI